MDEVLISAMVELRDGKVQRHLNPSQGTLSAHIIHTLGIDGHTAFAHTHHVHGPQRYGHALRGWTISPMERARRECVFDLGLGGPIREVDRTAMKLLYRWLSPRQQKQFLRYGGFWHVNDAKRCYYINETAVQLFKSNSLPEQFEQEGYEDGEPGIGKGSVVPWMSFCLKLPSGYSVYDQMLAWFLFLSNDESGFLQEANVNDLYTFGSPKEDKEARKYEYNVIAMQWAKLMIKEIFEVREAEALLANIVGELADKLLEITGLEGELADNRAWAEGFAARSAQIELEREKEEQEAAKAL